MISVVHKSILFKLQICYLLLACSASLFSQTYPYQQYTTHDGLVQHQAMNIFQDTNNKMWVGTKGGLSLFDGKQFINFITEKDGLAEMSVLDIVEDSKGRVTILTSTGLSFYNGGKLTIAPLQECRLSAPLIIGKDDEYFALSSKKDRIFKIEEGKCIDLLGEEKLPWERVLSFVFDKKNSRILIGTKDAGVFEWIEGKLNKLLGNEIKSPYFIFDTKGEIFISHYGNNSALYKINGKQYELLVALDKAARNICFVGENDFFFHVSQHLHRYKNGEFIDYNMQFNNINELVVDKEGILWLATEEGIIRMTSNAFTNYEYSDDGLVDYVWSMVEDDDKNIWFAGYRQGLCKFDGKEFTRVEVKGTDLPKHLRGFYYGAIKDRKGDLLFPIGAGLLRYDGQGFSQVKEAGDDPVLDLYEDIEEQNLLVGTKQSCRIITKNKEVIIVDKSKGLHTERYIVSIGKDKNGDYWLGSYDGLSRYNKETDRVVATYTEAEGTLPARGVIYIYKDYKDNMWLATTDGLLKYSYSSDQFEPIEKEKINGFVSFIAEIDSTHLLLGLSKEIAVFGLGHYYDRGTPYFTFYNNTNGFSGYNSDQNVFLKDSNDEIWIPASNLMSKFNPKKVKQKMRALGVEIKSLSIVSEKDKYSWNEMQNSLATSDQKLTIPRNQNSIKIEYGTTAYAEPRPVRYKFSLSKNEEADSWSESSTKQSIIYTDLPAGKYTFKVKSINSLGIELSEKKMPTITFVVKKAWWENRLVQFFLGLIALILLLMPMFYFTLKRENRILEEENKELEKNKLQNELLQLKQRMQSLQIEAIQSQLNYHFMANALNSIQYFIYKKDTITAAKYLKDLSILMRTFLEATKNQSFKISEELEFIKLYVEFEQLRFEDRFDVVYDIDAEVNLDELIPPMLLQPFVENAINHGILYKQEKGLLTVKIWAKNEQTIECIIEDDGVGRKRSKALQQKSLQPYKSRGIQIIKERIEIMKSRDQSNISIEIKDVLDTKQEVSGTIVSILVNLD